MRGFTLVEALIIMIVLSIVLATAGILMNSIYKSSILSFDRITAQSELFKIDAAIRRELLKSGPQIESLTVSATSVKFDVIVPFSKRSYGTYASATRLHYSIVFSDGKLELRVMDDSSTLLKKIELGKLENCVFSKDTSRPNLVRYTLVKRSGTALYQYGSSFLLYNLK
ncbi:MAG: prepilin-type N-terminal cleavage/methylation domain-containing protein [Pseudothermotoga sp.]|nr:prepilin-type N-terminal cleavage/methylation domain-containing protein [Pseudothermotoga sp.]